MKKYINKHQKKLFLIAFIMFLLSTFLFYRGIKDRRLKEESQQVNDLMTEQVVKFKQQQRVSGATSWLVKDDFLLAEKEGSWFVFDKDEQLLYPRDLKKLPKAVKQTLKDNLTKASLSVKTKRVDQHLVGTLTLQLSKNKQMKYLVFVKDLTDAYRLIYFQTLMFSLNIAFVLLLLLMMTTIYFYNMQQHEEMLHHEIDQLKLENKRRRNEYKQYVRQMNELMYHLVIGVMTINSHGEITMVNPAINEMLEENLYDDIGQNYAQVIKSDAMIHYIKKGFSKQKPVNAELTLYYQVQKILDLNIIPVKNRVTQEQDLIVLLYDTTEIRRLEKVRTDFVANASHELRTPITALKGFAETLLDGAMNDPKVLKDFLQIINKEATRLDSIVHDILQISKLEQRAVPLDVEKVNVGELVREVLQILKQKLEMKAMSYRIVGDEPLILMTSYDQLKQILINLINNAILYTPEQGDICISLKATEETAVIEVSDNGIGIAAEEMDRIFERFYRVDKGRSRNAGGTGLGLSIVRWLVDNLEGTIEVKSQLDEGSIFIVRLPKNLHELSE